MQKANKKYKTIFIATFWIANILFVTSCHESPNKPGYTFFPDMEHSRAYETYSENTFFEDSSSIRISVKGTIPRGFIPFQYDKTDEGLVLAGKQLNNPLENTKENLERGKEIYDRTCLNCHGPKGVGDGPLFTGGKYPLKPKDLNDSIILARSDGEYYHIITLGRGGMGALGSILQPDDRWKVIMYVRKEVQDIPDSY